MYIYLYAIYALCPKRFGRENSFLSSRGFLENSQNMFLVPFFFLTNSSCDPGKAGGKAGITMMIKILNKVADFPLLFVIILGKYLALTSVRSFQY